MISTLYTHVEEAEIYEGPNQVVTGAERIWRSPSVTFAANEVGMLALDYAIKAAVTSAGEITQAEAALITQNTADGDDIERQRIRGSRTWTRAFLQVDSGTYKVGVASNDQFRSTDGIYVRRVFAHKYRVSSHVHAIDQLKPPKPLYGVQKFDTLEGTLRMQRTGSLGCEIEFTLCFISESKYQSFMKSRHDGYMVIKTRYGTYGGYLQGTDTDPESKGSTIFLRVKMLSPQRAGVGVNGL
ncbi:hypothetical protein [Staphylococcus aureus]|uniref:hypothetical protein n=1 Tax=Staphylococcus aureus TaxID=1280 RepID=UPI0020BD4895|nr:hypothetical protein [Staphylococcus aureus]